MLKRLLLSLGSLVATGSSVAAVVSCGKNDKVNSIGNNLSVKNKTDLDGKLGNSLSKEIVLEDVDQETKDKWPIMTVSDIPADGVTWKKGISYNAFVHGSSFILNLATKLGAPELPDHDLQKAIDLKYLEPYPEKDASDEQKELLSQTLINSFTPAELTDLKNVIISNSVAPNNDYWTSKNDLIFKRIAFNLLGIPQDTTDPTGSHDVSSYNHIKIFDSKINNRIINKKPLLSEVAFPNDWVGKTKLEKIKWIALQLCNALNKRTGGESAFKNTYIKFSNTGITFYSTKKIDMSLIKVKDARNDNKNYPLLDPAGTNGKFEDWHARNYFKTPWADIEKIVGYPDYLLGYGMDWSSWLDGDYPGKIKIRLYNTERDKYYTYESNENANHKYEIFSDEKISDFIDLIKTSLKHLKFLREDILGTLNSPMTAMNFTVDFANSLKYLLNTNFTDLQISDAIKSLNNGSHHLNAVELFCRGIVINDSSLQNKNHESNYIGLLNLTKTWDLSRWHDYTDHDTSHKNNENYTKNPPTTT